MPKINIEQIYNEYFKIVYKYLVCLTNNKEIAEDLTQETFCKVIVNIDRFQGDCKMSTWICQIAKNLWLNELKKRKKLLLTNICSEEIDIPYNYNIEDDFINKQNLTLIYKKIKDLGKPLDEIFYLKLFSDLTFKEIGEINGKTEVWARVNFYRGKQKIKELMKNEEKL